MENNHLEAVKNSEFAGTYTAGTRCTLMGEPFDFCGKGGGF